MVDLTIEARLKRVQELARNLETIDMVSLHSDLGEEGRNIIEERFDKSRDPKGKKWKKIKKYFNEDANRLRLPSDKPLKLLDLFKSFSYNASADQVFIGTPKQYAKYHTDAPSNNGARRRIIPLREFMGYESREDIDALLDVVEDHLEMAVRK